jgi:hypothetical protein
MLMHQVVPFELGILSSSTIWEVTKGIGTKKEENTCKQRDSIVKSWSHPFELDLVYTVIMFFITMYCFIP